MIAFFVLFCFVCDIDNVACWNVFFFLFVLSVCMYLSVLLHSSVPYLFI